MSNPRWAALSESDIAWREVMIRHLQAEIEMLENGPRGSIEGMAIGSLKKRYESIYGDRD